MENKPINENQNQEKPIYVKTRYSDTVFRYLYKDKKKLLSLFNALNGTDYTNEDDLEVVTLENAIYMTMRNDVSCLLDMNLQLYEHQSTINPNMPLRDLMYVARQLEKMVVNKDIYSRKLIPLPNPRFIVFYNGKDKQPERKELLLSDAYEHKDKEINLELKVLQLNINQGYNEDIKRECSSLFEYMQYVDTVRRFAQDNSLEEAVQKAVDTCIENDILKDFLLANKAEVTSMSIFEYDEEQHHKTLHDEGFEEGYNVAVAEKDKEYKEAVAEKDREYKEAVAEKDKEIERLKKLLEEK